MVSLSRPKPPQNRVAISTRDLARRMRKRLNKTTEGIEAAVAKVKNNAETWITYKAARRRRRFNDMRKVLFDCSCASAAFVAGHCPLTSSNLFTLWELVRSTWTVAD